MKKGSSQWKEYERRIAKALGEWWVGDPSAFRRRPLSGGWPKKRSHGDVFPVAEGAADFPFTVDVKVRSGAVWKLAHLLRSPVSDTCPLAQWWGEMGEITKHTGKCGLLIFTRPYADTYAMVSAKGDPRDSGGTLLEEAFGPFGPRIESTVGGHGVVVVNWNVLTATDATALRRVIAEEGE